MSLLGALLNDENEMGVSDGNICCMMRLMVWQAVKTPITKMTN